MIVDEYAVDLAWKEVVKTARRLGGFSSVQFNDRIIHSAIEAMGGWECFCDDIYFDKDLEQVHQKFRRLYFISSNKNKHPGYLKGQ